MVCPYVHVTLGGHLVRRLFKQHLRSCPLDWQATLNGAKRLENQRNPDTVELT